MEPWAVGQPIFFECMADLLSLTEEALAGMGLELVDVERAPMGLLRVTIDRPSGAGSVRIEDCEQVSRQLSRVYEVENIDYRRLEVTSPGTDRVLRTRADLLRFAGERVEVKLRCAQDNQKVFVGCLHVALPETASGANGPVDGSGDAAGPFEFELELEDAPRSGRARKAGAGKGNAAGADGMVRVLRFAYEDVERARLSPVLDFKGKKR